LGLSSSFQCEYWHIRKISIKISRMSKHRIICLLVFLLGSLYFLSYYQFGANIWDEGVPLSGALRLQAGEKPTSDFTAYPPGRYYLYSLALKATGGSVSGPRIIMALLSGFTGLLIYILTVPFLRMPYRFLPVILYLLMPVQYYYRFFALCLLMGILLVTHQFRKMTPVRLTLIVLGVVLVIWFREVLGILLTVAVFYVSVLKIRSGSRKERVFELFPVVAVTAAWFMKILYLGGIKECIDFFRYSWGVAAVGRSGMRLPWPNIFNPGYWKANGLFYGIEDLLIYMSGIVIIISTWVGYRHYRREVRWWVLLFGAFIGYGLVLWRTGYGNLLRCFPPIAILATVIIWGKSQATLSKRTLPLLKPAVRAVYIVFFFLIALDSLSVNPGIYDSIGIRSKFKTRLMMDKMQVVCGSRDAAYLKEITGYLRESLRPGGGLVCLPFHTIWNFLTGELNPTPHEWILPGMYPDREAQRKVLRDFQENPPDVILLNDSGFDNQVDRKFSVQYRELYQWIRREYYRWMELNEFEIYKRLPMRKTEILKGDAIDLFRHVKGINRVETLCLENVCWPVILQTEGAELGYSGSFPPNMVFKSGIMVNDSWGSGSADFSLALKIGDSEPVELVRKTMESGRNSFDEILWYITIDDAVIGELILKTTGQIETGWINPLIFHWPQVYPHVDNNQVRN